MSLMERLPRWSCELEAKPKPVTGWLVQWFLMLLAAVGLCYGVNVMPYVAASLVIGVMRAIERERREGNE